MAFFPPPFLRAIPPTSPSTAAISPSTPPSKTPIASWSTARSCITTHNTHTIKDGDLIAFGQGRHVGWEDGYDSDDDYECWPTYSFSTELSVRVRVVFPPFFDARRVWTDVFAPPAAYVPPSSMTPHSSLDASPHLTPSSVQPTLSPSVSLSTPDSVPPDDKTRRVDNDLGLPPPLNMPGACLANDLHSDQTFSNSPAPPPPPASVPYGDLVKTLHARALPASKPDLALPSNTHHGKSKQDSSSPGSDRLSPPTTSSPCLDATSVLTSEPGSTIHIPLADAFISTATSITPSGVNVDIRGSFRLRCFIIS
ncbi:hypothetical protein CF327_g7197 [Tilletia walkeri]|uniref:Uncharacterized protein n=1 Tax=Tilletia walkeri TaxID=117179 RepID=A0A8X7N2E1_9BASI|nr:hypothetical protein CF327_g7197 [Tilletia walkeri]KAE8263656.1 hypothetical protein A4X09_0g7174 [Tilletia walkeri]